MKGKSLIRELNVDTQDQMFNLRGESFSASNFSLGAFPGRTAAFSKRRMILRNVRIWKLFKLEMADS